MAEHPANDGAPWIRRFLPAPGSAHRLVCLAHAGGSSSFYFPVARALSPRVEVLAVQYPGRQERHSEPQVESIPDLADQIFAALRPFAGQPLAFFGHSMGAVVAYELALRLQSAGLPAPTRLFASGRRAPSRYRDESVHARDDAGVLRELRLLAGPDTAFLDDPDVLALSLPAIRADYTAIEAYRHEQGRVLDCPVTVLTGADDPRVSIDEAEDWARHTTGPTDVRIFAGGHFFLTEHPAEVIGLIAARLNAAGGDPGADGSGRAGSPDVRANGR